MFLNLVIDTERVSLDVDSVVLEDSRLRIKKGDRIRDIPASGITRVAVDGGNTLTEFLVPMMNREDLNCIEDLYGRFLPSLRRRLKEVGK